MPYPFDPYRPLGLPAPKFAEPLDPFAPVPGLPPPPALPDYSNWTLPQPAAPAKPASAGAWQTLKDIGGGVVETFRGIPTVVASMAEGVGNPHAERDWKDRLIEEGRQRQQADLQTLRDSGEYDRPMGLGMPFTRGEWAETTQSFPYTAATMGPAIVGGAAGGAIGGAIGGLGGPAAPATVPAGVAAGRAIGGTLGGMLGSYLPAGGAAANQFIRESLDRYRQDFAAKSGREPTPEEIDAHYKATVEPQASRVYHGEAAPEAAGTVAELGLMKSAIGDVLHGGGSLPVRIAKAGAKTALSAFGVEPATETITQQIQQPAYAATGLTDEAPRSLKSPEDWLKSAGEVYKQAAATSLFFSALGIPAGAMYGKYRQRQEGNARADSATQATADLRANLDFAREQDIAEALAGLDTVEAQGKVPKRAAERLAVARQQLTDELALRASPAALDEPMDNARGAAGYIGFADRPHELSDDQIFDLANRPLPNDAPGEWQDARIKYGIEANRRQNLNEAAAHFEQNPEAVAGVAKVLGDIAAGKPLAKGAHGSTDYNLASLSDDQLTRYRMAGEVLLRDRAEALGKARAGVEKSLELLHQENDRRNSGERRDPQAIREADVAQRVAQGAKGSAKLLDGLSPDALERMAAGLESRAELEPGLADTARQIRERAQRERMAGQQAAEQPAPQTDHSADRARLSELAQSANVESLKRQLEERGQRLSEARQARQDSILEREAQRRAALDAEIAARGQQAEPPAPAGLPAPPSLGVPRGAPTVASAAIPQSLGQLGRSRLGIGEDRLPVPASPAVNAPALPAPPSSRAPNWTDPERPALPPFAPLPAPEISPDARIRPVGPSQPVPGTAETAQAQPPVALPARPAGTSGARAEGARAETGAATSERRIEQEAIAAPYSEVEYNKSPKEDYINFRNLMTVFMSGYNERADRAEQELQRFYDAMPDGKPKDGPFSDAFARWIEARTLDEGDSPAGFVLTERGKKYIKRGGQWIEKKTEAPVKSKDFIRRLETTLSQTLNPTRPSPSQTSADSKTVSFDAATRAKDGNPVRIENAKIVDLGIPEIVGDERFAVHPSLEKMGGFIVSHVATGTKIGNPRTTEKGAIDAATDLIRNAGKEKFGKALSKYKKTSVSEASTVRGGQTGRGTSPTPAAQPRPETPDEKGQAEAKTAPLLNESPASETPDTTAPEKSPNPVESQRKTADKKADIAAGPGVTARELPGGATDKPEGYGKTNKIFTEDAAAKARELLKRKLGQLSAGIDPEILQAGITLAGYHIEAGARKFADYAKAMIADLGEAADPFLRSWYEGARYYPGMDAEGMTPAGEIDALQQQKAGKADESVTDHKRPGVGETDQEGSETDRGKRGRDRAKQGNDPEDDGVVEDQSPSDVESPEGGNAGETAGNRPARPVLEGGRQTDEGGDVVDGRQGTGGDMAADGAGRRRSDGGITDDAPVITYPNYHITDPKKLVGGTPKARFAKNKAAIETYLELEASGLQPTPDHLDAMAGYIGWGSFGQELFQGSWSWQRPKVGWEPEDAWLRKHLGKEAWESAQSSILNAHYTDPPTVLAMWDIARKLGFPGGRVLEPSMGVGNFFGLMPRDLMANSQLTGIELDRTTAGIAKLLYPDATVRQMGYQDSQTADNFYDLVIGNWPFAKQGPVDRRYNRLTPSLHDYFFLKALDQVRPGGLVIGVTSRFTMDKKGQAIRREMARKADLVASFRLPAGAFEEYAGTKVVTDIIVLKKRAEPVTSPSDAWIETVDTVAGKYDQEVTYNRHYINRPGDVLGKIDFGSGTTTGRPGLIVTRESDFAERLKAIADSLPERVYEPATTRETTRYLSEETKDRQQSATEGKDGKLYQVKGDRLARLEDVLPWAVKDAAKTADRETQIRVLIGIRRDVAALLEAERDSTVGDERVNELRATLKRNYSAFVAAHGPINESFGAGYLKKLEDPYYPDLAALETRNGNSWRPATVMERPTTRGKKAIGKPSVADALVVSRNERMDVDMARIADLAGTTPERASRQLIESGAVFEAPDGSFVVADQYLAGNVRRKLREAKTALEEGKPGMDHNVAALEKVIPKDVPYYNIEARMGASWIPVSAYQDFAKEILGVTDETHGPNIRNVGGNWKVDHSAIFNRAEAEKWETRNLNFRRALSAALNVRTVTIRAEDEKGNKVIDDEATREANQKIAELREEFSNWVWKSPDRQVELERTYNEIMNATASPSFDGSFLSFEGMAIQKGTGPFSLRQHQVDAIYRGLVNRRGLYAHEVGTGKTMAIAGIAIESRRYGIARKPLIFAHNANSEAVSAGIKEMYPSARVLYIDNLTPDTIDVRLRQIKMDDWDAVVVPHSLIGRFTLSGATLMELAQEEIDALESEAYDAAAEDNIGEDVIAGALAGDEDSMKKLRSQTAKDLVRARNQIIANIQKQALRSSKEGAVTFEELGVDQIIVDEAHLFKKPPISTRMSMRGLNKTASARSIAFNFLAGYIKKINGGTGVHLFTGTPITNTLTETYHMMRYIMDDEMKRDGLSNWDSWFNSFASETSDVEITSAGEYAPITRLATFINVADLRRMIGTYMDIVFADDMPEFKPRNTASGKTMADKLTDSEKEELENGRSETATGRPYKKVVIDSADMTPEQSAIMSTLMERAKTFRDANGKRRREIMLSGSPESPIIVETDASNAGLDQRLFKNGGSRVYPERSPNSKAARVVKNAVKHYRESPLSTQAIFMERGFDKGGFNLAKSIVDDLVANGIPRKQIAIVDGSTSNERRTAIADAMNRAEIRIVIGNTQTLGVGVNMQENLRAMHHLDAPWTPADLEQRNGRGHRQGNRWNTVFEYRYLTERLDGRRWQVLAVKDRFIKSFLKADENVRVIEGDSVDDSGGGDIVSTLSEAAGDPRILVAKKLKGDVEKLQARERLHGQMVVQAKARIEKATRDAEREEDRATKWEEDAATYDASKKERGGFFGSLGERTFDKREDMQTALEAFIKNEVVKATDAVHIGEINGIKIWYTWGGSANLAPNFYVGNKARRLAGTASVQAFQMTASSAGNYANTARQEATYHKESIAGLKKQAGEKFGRAEDLKRKKEHLDRVELDMQLNPTPAPSWLRNGAPLDSIAHLNGEPHVVVGHRWTDIRYAVELRSENGEKQIEAPYDEVTDHQGIKLYEPHPFVKPDRQSRPSSPTAQPVTVAQARTQLVEALGERHVAALERAGRLVLHESDPTQTGAAGFVDGKGVIHLIPGNMDRDALSVALHEGMHLAKDDRFAEGDRAKVRLAHAVMRIGGLKNFIGNPGFSDLSQQVYRMAAEGNPVAVEALNKAKLEGRADPRVDVAEEAVAYLAEYADQKYPLVRRVLAAIRAALYRMGIKINLTPADVRALALSALKARAKASGKAVAMREAPAYSLPDFAPTAADRAEVERQMKAVKEVRDAEGRLLAPNGKPSNLNERQWKQVRTKFFTDWFGNWESDPEHASKVVDANGEPLVVYHGTASDFKSFDKRKSFDGGFHFGDSASADDRISEHGYGYGANVMPAYLSIRNPSDEDDQYSEDRWATTIKQVKSDGYDGIVYENDIEGGESWVAFDPSQIKSAIGNAGTFSNRSNRIDYSQPTSETDAAEQARLWAEFQAVRAQFQAKEAMKTPFRRWFGHGTEGVTARDGKPLTLYHGTNSPAFHRWDASRAGQSSTHPTAGLGFFMTADKRAAMRYGSRLLELHAKIERPYHLTDADLWAIDSVEAATRLRAKLMAKGYDGAVIAAPGSSPYVIVFESKQAKYTGNEEPTDSEDFRYSRAWHGTPHDVDSFSLDKIGTGEGAQAYGHGLYFTDSEAIAEFYRKSVSADTAGTDERYLWNGQTYADKNDPVRHALSLVRHDGLASTRKLAKEWVKDAEDATERAYFEKLLETAESIRSKSEITSRKGYTYEVELAPRADEYLLWDKPLAQQSETVKNKLRDAGVIKAYNTNLQDFAAPLITRGKGKTGNDIYQFLSHREGSDKAASEYLHSIGVRGIKYLAADSRTKTGKGNHNYVIFDDKDVAVVARYSRPGRPPRMDSPRVAAKVLGDIGDLRDALRPGEKAKAKLDPRNWAQMLSDLKSDTRPAWLGLLSQDMLIQLAEKQLPAAEVRKFDDASEKMDAYESKTIQAEAFPLAERWQNLMTKDRQQADAMSRLIYMSTWWGVDPRQSAPDGKRAEWIRAKAVYDAMGAEAKKLYGDVLAFYEKQTERLFAELAARIERHALPDPDKLAAKDMLRQEFERMRKEGPYAPLMRFGDLTVWAEPRDKSDKPVFAAFESVAEQRAFADWLKGEGYRPRLGVKMDEIAKRALPQGDFVGKLAGIIDKTAKGPEAQILKDAMYQLFLRSLPEQAIRKHFIHRKFVPGYSSDALRTFATFARRSAKQTARLAHADRMSDALDKMAAAVRSGAVTDPVAAGHLVNELDKSYQWAMNPTTATWASRLTHLGFLWHLGASPAHLLLNLSQQAQVTAPWLAGELVGKKGFGAVAGALLKANKDFLAGNPFAAPEKRGPAANAARQKLEAEHGGDLGRALKALEEAGKTDKTQTYSIAGLSEEDNFLWTRPWTRKITQGAAWFFHVAEVVNREASAIAAYRLGRDAGMDHEAAYDLARRAINDTHFDYAPSNRARIMRGNVAKVLTLFKQYSLNITWQLGRNAYLAARGASKREKAVARTKLLGMLGMTFVMAGAVGMPFYGEVMWLMTQLLNATRDDDEPEWDADTSFRALLDRAIGTLFGEAAGRVGEQAVRRGLVNAFLGIDLSSRVKLDDLWWRDADSDLQGKQAAYHALEQGLGPVAGLAVRGFATANDAIDALLSGTNARGATWRALEGAMPKAIKDISKGLRFQTEGATTYEGARILEPGELGSAASVGQLMGFTPASLTERYAENRAMTNLQRRIQRQRDALLDSYAMAYRHGDEEIMAALREDMAAFGERYPGKRITGTTLRQSLKARERRREEIERYGGVALDKKLAGMLLEGGR